MSSLVKFQTNNFMIKSIIFTINLMHLPKPMPMYYVCIMMINKLCLKSVIFDESSF